jgi:hypothetical protein
MPDTPLPPEAAARIAELEAKVARLTYERDLLKSIACAKSSGVDQLPELTEEDFLAAMQEPPGPSLIEIIERHERKAGGP